jgi:hypothetical protein
VSLALSRLLVPLNYQRGSRWRRDLGVTVAPLPAFEVCASLDRYPGNALGFAQMHLARGMNAVLAALEEALERVDAAMPAATAQKRAG